MPNMKHGIQFPRFNFSAKQLGERKGILKGNCRSFFSEKKSITVQCSAGYVE